MVVTPVLILIIAYCPAADHDFGTGVAVRYGLGRRGVASPEAVAGDTDDWERVRAIGVLLGVADLANSASDSGGHGSSKHRLRGHNKTVPELVAGLAVADS